MKILKFSTALLFALVIITACTNSVSHYLTNANCDPPCFMGITPGSTDSLETNKALLSSPLVSKDSILGSGMLKSQWYPISYSYNWKFLNGERGVVWLTSESKVAYIEIIEPKINLRQFINVYGEPSSLLIVPYWGSKTHVYLVYPEIGVILDIRKTLSNKDDLSIQAFDSIKTINYIDKTLLNSVIHFFVFGDVYEETPESKLTLIKQIWVGFGKYTSINYWN